MLGGTPVFAILRHGNGLANPVFFVINIVRRNGMNKLTINFYLLLGLLLLIPKNEIKSQNLLTMDVMGFEDGKFSRKPVDFFDPGGSGLNCLWDFSGFDYAKPPHKVIQRIDSLGRMMVTDDKQVTYYRMMGDSLLEFGNESPLRIIYYHEPLCIMKYPMEVGDSISKKFEGYGIYCGDHYFKESGYCSVIVDGTGDILLSESDTLKNAFRVCKLRSYSIAMDIRPSNVDSAQLKQVIEERYEWYVKGCCKPIFESITSTSYSGLTPIGTTQYAYCCLPETKMYSMLDSKQENDKIQDDEDNSEPSGDIIHYKVDVDGDRVDVDYSLDDKANVNLLISNHMGVTYFCQKYTHDAGTGYHASFDIGNLPSGVYVLYINVNGKIYNEKIGK